MKKILFVFIFVFLQACGFEVVDTGHRGIETQFGKVIGESLDEGLHFYNPLTSDIIELDTRIQRKEIETACYTKDVQQATIKVVVNFSLNKSKAHLVFQEYGRNWEEIIIPQVLEGSIKTVIGKWDAVDLIANREKARIETENLVSETLKDKFKDYVVITKIELTNIDYNDVFEKAVEEKVTAIQKAKEAENRTKQVQEEAKQKIISAEAEARSMSIRAQALTQNKGLIEYEAVKKWNGVLPTYMLGNSTPFINLK